MMVNHSFALLNGESANVLELFIMELIRETKHLIKQKDGLKRLLIKAESLNALTKFLETQFKEPKRAVIVPMLWKVMKTKLNLSISMLKIQIKSMD
jgi:hypothetical protein